eukprot:TRINITY_DN17093_c0_g1_i1.p1 TRINITY_DN17093_c0_g1~~TRINITY_DN17093_c0_g1_i1.p1  ORF type:complete len:611 (-),score=109.41 TRINITY_DN17093_c0_g1_i1:380-2212(-)
MSSSEKHDAFIMMMLLSLLVACTRGSPENELKDHQRLRIAYVTNTWWPKVDGAAIAIVQHVRYFVSQGHAVVVVRPSFDSSSPLALSASGLPDPLPASPPLLSYIDFRMFGDRGGGFEPTVDPFEFPQVERQLVAWAPDVLLVADPDIFLFDAFRLPGFNTISRTATQGPVTIACFTTFMVDGALAMPEFWWLRNPLGRKLLEHAFSTAYGSFDHIFLNGYTSLEYIKPLRALYGLSEWRSYHQRARVISSRSVASNFCSTPSVDHCSSLPQVQKMRNVRLMRTVADSNALCVLVDGSSGGGGGRSSCDCSGNSSCAAIAGVPDSEKPFVLLYVGRLSFDKKVQNLLSAFAMAHAQQKKTGRKLPFLFIAGQGELLELVAEFASRLNDSLQYLGLVQHEEVSCIMREADAYVSAAPNETYGRSLVEAKRCGLPIVTVESGNMHVRHGVDGLLAASAEGLAEQIVSLANDPELHAAMAAKAAASLADDDSFVGSRAMLDAVLQARAQTLDLGSGAGVRAPRPLPWHPLWSIVLSISRVLDEPGAAAVLAFVGTVVVATSLSRSARGLKSVLQGKASPLWLAIGAVFELIALLIAAQNALWFKDVASAIMPV